MSILIYAFFVLHVCTKALLTRGSDKDNRAYFSSIFYNDYAKKTIDFLKLNIVINQAPGLTNNSTQGYIIISNHVNHFDIPILTYVFKGEIRFLVKKEMLKIPFWGPAMNRSEFIFIDRDNAANAQKSFQAAKKKINDGIKLLIYPEGTRSKTGKLQPFKKGAFHLAKQINVPIIPIGIVGLVPGEIPKNKTIIVNIGLPIDVSAFATTNELKEYAWQVVKELSSDKYTDENIGNPIVIPDFLPKPKDLVIKKDDHAS